MGPADVLGVVTEHEDQGEGGQVARRLAGEELFRENRLRGSGGRLVSESARRSACSHSVVKEGRAPTWLLGRATDLKVTWTTFCDVEDKPSPSSRTATDLYADNGCGERWRSGPYLHEGQLAVLGREAGIEGYGPGAVAEDHQIQTHPLGVLVRPDVQVLHHPPVNTTLVMRIPLLIRQGPGCEGQATGQGQAGPVGDLE